MALFSEVILMEKGNKQNTVRIDGENTTWSREWKLNIAVIFYHYPKSYCFLNESLVLSASFKSFLLIISSFTFHLCPREL